MHLPHLRSIGLQLAWHGCADSVLRGESCGLAQWRCSVWMKRGGGKRKRLDHMQTDSLVQ